MIEESNLDPNVSVPPLRRSRLIGIYVLGSFGLIVSLVLMGDAVLQGGDIGSRYETPMERPLLWSLLLSGGILFLASLGAVLWRLMPRFALLALQVAAVLGQLPAVLVTATAVRRFKPIGNDWGGNELTLVLFHLTLGLLGVAILIGAALVVYVGRSKVRGAFHA